MILKVIFANSVDPDQTAPPHCLPVCKNRFEMFARIFSRRHKQMTFSDACFLGLKHNIAVLEWSILLQTLYLLKWKQRLRLPGCIHVNKSPSEKAVYSKKKKKLLPFGNNLFKGGSWSFDSVSTVMVMSSWSVNLLALFPGQA